MLSATASKLSLASVRGRPLFEQISKLAYKKARFRRFLFFFNGEMRFCAKRNADVQLLRASSAHFHATFRGYDCSNANQTFPLTLDVVLNPSFMQDVRAALTFVFSCLPLFCDVYNTKFIHRRAHSAPYAGIGLLLRDAHSYFQEIASSFVHTGPHIEF